MALELASTANKKDRQVLTMGVFDLFHIGHLRYLQYARTRSTHLSVGVCPDAIVLTLKGKVPVILQEQRLEIIRGLGCVDKADFIPSSTEETQVAAQWIAAWGIDHVVVGDGWSDSPCWERLRPVLAERGISVEFAPQTTEISTSKIIKNISKSLGISL